MPRPQSIVVKIVLGEGIALFADSTSTYKLLDLNVVQIEDLLPHASAMTLEVLLDKVATNEIDWNIDAFPGWDRDHELAVVPVFGSGATPSDQTTAGPQLLAVTNITQASHYMQHMRLILKWRLHTGVSVAKQAAWSANLYVTLKN